MPSPGKFLGQVVTNDHLNFLSWTTAVSVTFSAHEKINSRSGIDKNNFHITSKFANDSTSHFVPAVSKLT